jgi:phosphoribosylformylglycinamidine cyclo-ligase
LGGETAEMPGLYQPGDFDLAGFVVGIVDKSKIPSENLVQAGDILIGMASSGPHSNGYSLIRTILNIENTSMKTLYQNKTLEAQLLAPTKIYVKSLLALREKITIHAMAHITGGGLLENIPRVLPPHTQAVIETQRWQRPAIFDWIQQAGQVDFHEMHRTFNCGVGMVLCIKPDDVDTCLSLLSEYQETAFIIGHIEASDVSTPSVNIISA